MASSSAPGLRYAIDLPALDGYVEAGIAAGVDPTLPQGDKLPINGSNLQEVLNNAFGWAETKKYSKCREQISVLVWDSCHNRMWHAQDQEWSP